MRTSSATTTSRAPSPLAGDARLGLACVLVTFVLVGCGGPTYVNVPAEKGDIALHGTNRDAVRAVTIQAIGAVIDQTPLRAPVILRMPEGTDTLTIESMIGRLDHPTVAAGSVESPSSEEAARLSVDAIRIRANTAEVDIYRAQAGGRPALVTVHLDWVAGGGWSVERLRTWHIPVPEDAI